MKSLHTIPVNKFRAAYQKLKWIEEVSNSEKYFIWTNPNEASVWTRLPVSEDALDYPIYQDKNILMLLYALQQEETTEEVQDLISQLKSYNYKLINRIIGKKNQLNPTVPYELANVVPDKNIEAFRYFYQTKSSKKKPIPIERFELNHTEVGSFIIPISITVEDESQASLIPLQNDTNRVLHEYLDAIDTLKDIPRTTALKFADKVIQENIDSKIVKDFFGIDKSIARYTEKYSNEVNGVFIGSKGSMLLDYGLNSEQKSFKEVDITGIGMLDKEFIETLEEREILADNTRLEEREAKIDVVIDSIDRSGKVKFLVTGIGNSEIKKPFKAYSSDLPKAKLDIFAELFKRSGETTLSGDIFKQKGRVGRIVVDNIGKTSSKQDNANIFDQLP